MAMSVSKQCMFKLIIVGDSGVGKSCCLLRWCDDAFSPSFIATVGIDFKIKSMYIGNKYCSIQTWDTAGQEKFQTITKAYYRGAMGVLLVYDVTNEQSFNNIRMWNYAVDEHAISGVSKILLGNKCDEEEKRVVSTEQGQALANDLGMPFKEVSAKSDLNIDEAFTSLLYDIDKRYLAVEANFEAQKQQSVEITSNGRTTAEAGRKCC